MLNDLSVLKDVDEIDHITVHYRREGRPLDKKEAVRLIKKNTAVYSAAAGLALGFDPKFITEEELSEPELFEALVKLREALMTQIGFGKNNS